MVLTTKSLPELKEKKEIIPGGKITEVNLPKCAIPGCNNSALALVGGEWICGECLADYDKMTKEKMFNDLKKWRKENK